MTEAPLLEIDDLQVVHGERPLLDGLGLRLEAGALVALVGPSGAGKSLTARACLGLLPAGLRQVRGEIRARASGLQARIPPLPAQPEGLGALRGRILGLLPQDSRGSLQPERSVGAQLAAARRHAGVAADPAALRAALHEVGLTDADPILSAAPHRLSGGQAQRVALALALASQPALLLADEPTTGLDSTVQAAVMAELRRRVDAGLGLLLITHDLGLVRRWADQVLILDGGRLVDAGRGLPAGAGRAAAALLEGQAALEAAQPPADRPEAPALLRADGLCRRFSTGPPWARLHVNAVQQVDLEVREGEALGICGESGSGKTTLARLIIGADRPTAGRLWRDPALNGRVQLLFQQAEAHLDPDWPLSALLDESTAVARRVGRDPAPDPGGAAALAALGLAGRGGDRLATLSGGERRRVGFARVRRTAPLLLVADEPTAGLDAALRAEVLGLLRRTQAEAGPRAALVLISHDLGLLRAAAGRLLVMRAGRVVEELPTAQLGAGPHHPFTWALLVAAGLAPGAPGPLAPPRAEGCPHRGACPVASAACAAAPDLRAAGPGHKIACHHPPAAPSLTPGSTT
jgi:peptide/nickel transport system ATP-binding protein